MGDALIGMGVVHEGVGGLVTITDDVAQIHALFMPAGMEQMRRNMVWEYGILTCADGRQRKGIRLDLSGGSTMQDKSKTKMAPVRSFARPLSLAHG